MHRRAPQYLDVVHDAARSRLWFRVSRRRPEGERNRKSGSPPGLQVLCDACSERRRISRCLKERTYWCQSSSVDRWRCFCVG